MRRDRLLLRLGYTSTVVLAALVYVAGLGLPITIFVLIIGFITARSGIYLFYERYLAYRTFGDFTLGRIKHACIACGASCHLKVNLDKSDVERILAYAEQRGMKETIMEKHGHSYWLKRNASGACVFLNHVDNLPRCSIYSIRPTACRLYPLIPAGRTLKVDPLCPGLSKSSGHTLKEHLATQEIGPYVRKVLGKI